MSRSKHAFVLSGPVQAFVFHKDTATEIAALHHERLCNAEHATKMAAAAELRPTAPQQSNCRLVV